MLAALVVVVAVLAVYVDALGGPFLWDDRALIVNAELVERGAGLGEYMRHPFWIGAGADPDNVSYYRPLVSWSFALDHRLHGSNPGGYHLTNLVLHAVNALILLALLRKQGTRAAVAALLATAWALLPRLAESAAWISGRTDVLASTFALGALLAWGRPWSRRVLAAGLLGLGLLAKESALAVLPAVLVSEWLRARDSGSGGAARRVVRDTAALWGVVLAYLALRFWAVGFKDEAVSLGALGRLRTVFDTAGTYVLLLFDAWRPRAVIGRLGAYQLWHGVLGVAATLALAVFLVKKGPRLDARTLAGLALALGALLPVLHIVPIPLRTLAADRFLYLPMAGLALAVAPAVDAWLAERRLVWSAAVLLVASLALTTARRVRLWSDEIDFWTQTYLETPRTNNAAAIELVGVFYRAGLYVEALDLSRLAQTYDDPHRGEGRYNEALCLSRLGRREEALNVLGRGRWPRSKQGEVARQSAILQAQLGRVELARAALEMLVNARQPGASWLLAHLPEFELAHAERRRLGPDGDAEALARLSNLIADDPSATRYWGQVARSRTASKESLELALRYLVQTGDRDAILAALGNHLARFGAPTAELAAIAEVRVAEVARLVAQRPRLGLGKPPPG